MSDLLEVAVAAHGGLDRWNGITSIEVAASITGATWFVKGKGDVLKNVRLEVDTTRELLTMEFVGQGKRSIFQPSRVVMQRADGALGRSPRRTDAAPRDRLVARHEARPDDGGSPRAKRRAAAGRSREIRA